MYGIVMKQLDDMASSLEAKTRAIRKIMDDISNLTILVRKETNDLKEEEEVKAKKTKVPASPFVSAPKSPKKLAVAAKRSYKKKSAYWKNPVKKFKKTGRGR